MKAHLWGIIPFDNETLCVCACVKLPGVILYSFANSPVAWKLRGSGVSGIAFLWEKAFQEEPGEFFPAGCGIAY